MRVTVVCSNSVCVLGQEPPVGCGRERIGDNECTQVLKKWLRAKKNKDIGKDTGKRVP